MGVGRRSPQRGDRGGVKDHATLPGGRHRPGRALAEHERGRQVDLYDRVPFVDRHLQERRRTMCGGIAHQDVEAPGRRHRLVHGPLAIRQRGDITDQFDHVGPPLAYLGRHPGQVLGVPVEQAQRRRPFFGKPFGRCPAHPARRPGNDGGTTLQSLAYHLVFLLCRCAVIHAGPLRRPPWRTPSGPGLYGPAWAARHVIGEAKPGPCCRGRLRGWWL